VEINFIQQICNFDKLSAENLNANAIAIYYHLFNVNNRCGWKEWFTEPDLWIERAVGISRRETVLKALNLLKQKGFIDFKRGERKGQPSKYKILPLINSGYDSAKDSGRNSDIPKQKTKTKKEKREEAPKIPKKEYAENVLMTEEEYKKLVDYFNGREDIVQWCITTLNDYKGASGKKYTSDYYAIRKWVISEYEKKREEKLAKMPKGDDLLFENLGKGIAS